MKRFGINIIFYFFITLLLLGCAGHSVKQGLLKSMIELDKRYIPALVFTDLEQQRESELAMDNLKREWSKFKEKYYNLEMRYGLNITDKFWKEDFDRIQGLIVSAEGYIKEENLGAAHESLKEVRLIFLELRHRNGLNYFLDPMTRFDNSMESIVSLLRGKDKLSDKDLDNLQALAVEAKESLDEAIAFNFEPDLYKYTPEKSEAIKKKLKDEREELQDFEKAVEEANSDMIFQTAQDLKPGFMVLYKSFGNFQSILDRAKQERKKKEAEEAKIKEKEESKNSQGGKNEN
jgi:hypothetical protein